MTKLQTRSAGKEKHAFERWLSVNIESLRLMALIIIGAAVLGYLMGFDLPRSEQTSGLPPATLSE